MRSYNENKVRQPAGCLKSKTKKYNFDNIIVLATYIDLRILYFHKSFFLVK